MLFAAMAVAGDVCARVWVGVWVGGCVCLCVSVFLNVRVVVCPANAICSIANAVNALRCHGCGM